MKHPKFISALAILLLLATYSCDQPIRDLHPKSLDGGLILLPPEQTGIDFNNAIAESKTLNHLYYNQIYTGAGVAIGDINNDGLSDIYFCGNQINDRLYLNKGGFKFEDITTTSKAASHPGWSWGVTMADVNADGFLDIYVSRNGASLNPENCRNRLYINNGDLTFTESAKVYGLDDAGFSSQAVFFDMDQDGDLDMFQANQPPDSRVLKRLPLNQDHLIHYTDKLYRNDGGRFTNVSEEAGINHGLAYGLSVSASDFNNDGLTDLYVANDYDEPDVMYYNNGDGTFTNVIDKTLKHISRFSMGTDSGDINNDGLMDLLVLDMAAEDHYRSKTNMGSMNTAEFWASVEKGNHFQYMFNVLQVNSGKGTFSEIANMAGIAKTDWSWAGLLVDMDNDGWKDIIVSNGIKKDIRNNDFLTAINSNPNFSSDYFYDLTQYAPSSPLPNYMYRNNGKLKFDKVTDDWGFNAPAFSSGMAYGDLDNDGDLDLVLNNMESPAFVYENKAQGNFVKINLKGPANNPFGIGAKASINYAGTQQVAEHTLTRGYFSSVEPGLFFGLGSEILVDHIEIIWPDGKTNIFRDIEANGTVVAHYADALDKTVTKTSGQSIFGEINPDEIGLDFVHEENDYDDFIQEILLPHKLSQNGPYTTIADVNGDGLEDLFIGGAAGQTGLLYLQDIQGSFRQSDSQPWTADRESEDLDCLFFDADADGDMDLYVASGGNAFRKGDKSLADRLYINNGLGEFTRAYQALPEIHESTQCIQSADIDEDGDLDLFVGTRHIPGKYPHPASSYVLVNNGGSFTKAQTLADIGLVTDAVFTDFDGDKDPDLIIVGEWMPILFFENNNGRFTDVSDRFKLGDTRGLWWSLTAGDIDNDGDIDFVVGNLGQNNKFKATPEHPFKVYANDFDQNGTNDVVLANYYNDDYVPLRGRECTSQQMPYVAEKFKDYHSFASSKLVDILPEETLEGAVIYEISNFESLVLMNNSGNLTKGVLPPECQVSPIKSSVMVDVNKDGFMDIVMVGNHYGVEVETARYDAGIGAVLLGDGSGNFEALSAVESGLYVPFDSRHITTLNTNQNHLVLVSNNNDRLEAFQLRK